MLQTNADGTRRAEADAAFGGTKLKVLTVVGADGRPARFEFGWWWADPVAALVMIPIIVKEGVEALRGETCCDEGACR